MMGYKKNTKLYVVTLALVVLMVFALTIGYAVFAAQFSIANTVAHFRVSTNTRISGVTTNSPYISNLDYGANSIVSSASIPSGGTVTYQVTLTTYDNAPMALSNITVTSGVVQLVMLVCHRLLVVVVILRFVIRVEVVL